MYNVLLFRVLKSSYSSITRSQEHLRWKSERVNCGGVKVFFDVRRGFAYFLGDTKFVLAVMV